MGLSRMNITKADKERLYGKKIGENYWLTNGHWAVQYNPFRVKTDAALAAYIETGASFSFDTGKMFTDSVVPNIENVLPKERGVFKLAISDILIQEQGCDRLAYKRLLVAEDGELTILNDAYLDQLAPFFSMAAEVRTNSIGNGPVELWDKDDQLLAVIMPMRSSEIPDFLVRAFKREAKLAKKEAVAV